MAISVVTDSPRALLEAVKQAIRDGLVDTWTYKEGYFTHSPEKWRYKAFLKPSMESEDLILNIIGPKDQDVSAEVYAVYHGRFIEMLLAHFDRALDSATATSMPIQGDLV
jgi:hypothetical protein